MNVTAHGRTFVVHTEGELRLALVALALVAWVRGSLT